MPFFNLQRRNAVIKRLAGRSDNISAAQWSEAIRILAEQIEGELHETNRANSETLEMLNASLATAKKRRKQLEKTHRDSAPRLVGNSPEFETGRGADLDEGAHGL